MPVCPKCHKQMKKKSSLSLSYALQKAIDDAIHYIYGGKGAPDQWACVSMLPNPEYRRWEEKKKQYDKKLIKVGKLPSPPMEFIPCDEHWQLKGSPKASVPTKKTRKNFFIEDETTGMISKVKHIF